VNASGRSVNVRGEDKLTVLTVIDTLMTAGAETVATRIALGLDGSRFQSVLCATRPSAPEHVAAARAMGVEVLELNRRSKFDVWRLRPLVRLLRGGSVDVVHAHKFASNLWGALLVPRSRLPVLLAHEHTWSYEGMLRRVVDRELIARRAGAIVAVSPRDRVRMIELEGIPAGKVVLIPNGIPDRPVGDRTRARRELGLAPGTPWSEPYAASGRKRNSRPRCELSAGSRRIVRRCASSSSGTGRSAAVSSGLPWDSGGRPSSPARRRSEAPAPSA